MREIILASNSPRRKELLAGLGLEFKVMPDNTPEVLGDNLLPSDAVCELAKFKGENIKRKLSRNQDTIIISADTVVAVGDKILGKPKNENEAEEMLKLLSGNTHCVYTGVYVTDNLKEKSVNFYEKTEVRFKSLDINEIKDYINTGEPMDKAGAYGVQGLGSLFVEKIDGDYFNVVGLPLCSLGKVLKKDFNIKFF